MNRRPKRTSVKTTVKTKALIIFASLFAFAVAEVVPCVAHAQSTSTTKKKKKRKGAATPATDDSALDMGTPAATPSKTGAAPAKPAAAAAAPAKPAAVAPATAATPPPTPPASAAPATAAPAKPATGGTATTSRKKRPRQSKGQVVFDFSDASNTSTEVSIDLKSSEKKRYDKAEDYMTDEKWNDAVFEWQAILEDPKSAPFKREAQYQLAKATYKLGFFNAALDRFKEIILQGEQHPRYQKSVEWLFFISRKLVDETPVLEELAQFTNVQWPRKYKNEYRYLLAKYQYLRGYDLEVQRLQDEEQKKYKAAATPETGQMDFSGDAAVVKPANEMDFSADDGARGGGNKNIGSMEFSTEDVDNGGKKTEKLVDVIADVRKLVAQIPPDSKYYPRGKYLEGLASFLEGNDQLGVDAFRQVIQLLNPRKNKQSDPKLREQAFLSLARAHYGYQQFRAAAYYYAKIDKKSDAWLDSLFEASWAFYRMSDYEKALGNLVTLHSPFFVNEYYPEATILEAVVYYENCRYDQVKLMLRAFDKRYTPLMESMKKLSEMNLSSAQYYQKLAELQRSSKEFSAQQLVRILNVALSDQEVRRADSSVREVEREMAEVKKLPKRLAESMYAKTSLDDLAKVLTSRQARAGDLAKSKIDREYLHLRDLVGQALRIQFETVTVEKTTLESKLAGEQTQENRKYAYSVATDDEKLYWPFDGEYWYDELGTYQYSMSSGCK